MFGPKPSLDEKAKKAHNSVTKIKNDQKNAVNKAAGKYTKRIKTAVGVQTGADIAVITNGLVTKANGWWAETRPNLKNKNEISVTEMQVKFLLDMRTYIQEKIIEDLESQDCINERRDGKQWMLNPKLFLKQTEAEQTEMREKSDVLLDNAFANTSTALPSNEPLTKEEIEKRKTKRKNENIEKVKDKRLKDFHDEEYKGAMKPTGKDKVREHLDRRRKEFNGTKMDDEGTKKEGTSKLFQVLHNTNRLLRWKA